LPPKAEVTEGDVAGASEQDLQRLATHINPATTRRYIRSTTLNATGNVARLRSAARQKNDGGTIV